MRFKTAVRAKNNAIIFFRTPDFITFCSLNYIFLQIQINMIVPAAAEIPERPTLQQITVRTGKKPDPDGDPS